MAAPTGATAAGAAALLSPAAGDTACARAPELAVIGATVMALEGTPEIPVALPTTVCAPGTAAPCRSAVPPAATALAPPVCGASGERLSAWFRVVTTPAATPGSIATCGAAGPEIACCAIGEMPLPTNAGPDWVVMRVSTVFLSVWL